MDIANYINTLGQFCGIRDIEALTSNQLFEKYGIAQADVAVLFGGSVLAGGDVFAGAIKNNVANKYVIVGGAGHTTNMLRKIVHQEFSEIETKDLSEAEIFQKYLKIKYGLNADYLETESTNCGNNVTYLLDLLHDQKISFKSIILIQDATMQRRMDAVLRKYALDDITIVNYASYNANVLSINDELVYDKEIHGMWSIERYVHLLMGEIPRLTDDENGYGPRGKDFIAHVDIPEDVRFAFEELKAVFGDQIREANPLYA